MYVRYYTSENINVFGILFFFFFKYLCGIIKFIVYNFKWKSVNKVEKTTRKFQKYSNPVVLSTRFLKKKRIVYFERSVLEFEPE